MHNKYDKNSFDQKVYQQKTTIFIKIIIFTKSKTNRNGYKQKRTPRETVVHDPEKKTYKIKKN